MNIQVPQSYQGPIIVATSLPRTMSLPMTTSLPSTRVATSYSSYLTQSLSSLYLNRDLVYLSSSQNPTQWVVYTSYLVLEVVPRIYLVVYSLIGEACSCPYFPRSVGYRGRSPLQPLRSSLPKSMSPFHYLAIPQQQVFMTIQAMYSFEPYLYLVYYPYSLVFL